MSIRNGCVVVFGALALTTTAMGVANPIANNTLADRTGLLSGKVPLDLSASPFATSGAFSNEYLVNYVSPFGAVDYSGTMKLEVFGNVGLPGGALTDVVMIYTFTGNSAAFGIDGFEFGVDTSTNIDAADLISGTHGRIAGESTLAQLSPSVDVQTGLAANDHWAFDFITTEGAGPTDRFGLNANETFVWYVTSSADVALGLVEVDIFNNANSQVLMPTFVKVPGQPDLGIPAPGATALMLGAGFLATRRRRA